MIVYPEYWRDIGKLIKIKEIEDKILSIVSEIKCNCLALSGGLDSSLLLYYMRKVHNRVKAFTIGHSEKHPDIQYARLAAWDTIRVEPRTFIPSEKDARYAQESEEIQGDGAVRLFYKWVAKFTDSIVAGDGKSPP